MPSPWPRCAPELALLLLASSSAQALPPVAERCTVAERAWVISLDGDPWPERERAGLEAQLAIEAARLGLTLCRSGPPSPRASARASLGADGIALEVRAAAEGKSRQLERTFPRERWGAPELMTELAIVLGELVREASLLPAAPAPPPAPVPVAEAPPAPAPPPERRSYALGARAAGEVLGASGSLFFGLDLSARLPLSERWYLAASAAGRLSPTSASALGSAQAWSVGGGGAVGLELWRPGELQVLAELGARLTAVHLGGASSNPTTTAEQHWSWQAHAALGLEVDYLLSPRASLGLRAGATLALRGVTAIAGAERPLSTSGGGAYLSVGSEAWF